MSKPSVFGGGRGVADEYPGDLGWALRLDASYQEKVWQNAAGTTPAVATNPVGAFQDMTADARHFTQSTDANRPILSAWDGRLEAIESVDSTDILNGNAASLTLARNIPGLTFCGVIDNVSAAQIAAAASVLFRISSSGAKSLFTVFIAQTGGELTLQSRRADADASASSLASASGLTGSARYVVICSVNYVDGAMRVSYAAAGASLTTATGTASWIATGLSEDASGSAVALIAAPGGGTPFVTGLFALGGVLQYAMTPAQEARWNTYAQGLAL